MKAAKFQFTLSRLRPMKTMLQPEQPAGAKPDAKPPDPVPTVAVSVDLQSVDEKVRGTVQLQFRDQPELLALLDSGTAFTVEIKKAP